MMSDIQEVDKGVSQVEGQPGQLSEILCQYKKSKQKF